MLTFTIITTTKETLEDVKGVITTTSITHIWINTETDNHCSQFIYNQFHNKSLQSIYV